MGWTHGWEEAVPNPRTTAAPLDLAEWGSHTSECMSMDRRFWVPLPEPLIQQSWRRRWVGPGVCNPDHPSLFGESLLKVTGSPLWAPSFFPRDPYAGVGAPALGGPPLFRVVCLHAHAWVTAPAPLPRTPACRSHPLTLLGMGTEGPGAPEPAVARKCGLPS